jgi:S-adenosylmethionine:diacylglycerol 3-amino-3-carboxypropyl transferase
MMTTPWHRGSFNSQRPQPPQLLFGRMYEDAAIELKLFRPGSRVFSIASAGCTARALAAAGHRVTAVDVNPRQLEYAQSRAAGGRVREGAAERMLSRSRALLGLIGWSRRKLNAFLELNDPAEQIDYWDRNLDSSLWRVGVDTALSPWLLRMVYADPFVDFAGSGFGERIRGRLRRCWANHPNRSNPYAWNVLLESRADHFSPAVHPIAFACADAATFLETCEPASFDAFSLSNIEDGAPPDYTRRLRAAVRQAAAPGAISVLRSFAEPRWTTGSNWAARDRSLLWGSVNVLPVGGN